MYELLGLGVTLSKWLTGKIAYQSIDDVEQANPSTFLEHLRKFLQKDIDRIGTKLESQSHSKISSALHYVKRALALMQQDLNVLNQFRLFPKCYGMPGVQAYLCEADKWATEAFYDKANVSAKWRLEACKIQMFCSLLLNTDQKTDKILILWKEILTELLHDKELVQSVVSKSVLFPPDSEIKLTVIQLFQSVANYVISFDDIVDKKLICDLWAVLIQPNFQNHNHQSSTSTNLEWYRICFSGLINYQLVDRSYIVISHPYHQFCLLPSNQLCTIVPSKDGAFLLKILENSNILIEKSIPSNDSLNYYTVAYDAMRDAILVVQRKSIEMYDKQLNSLGYFDTESIVGDNKCILCSPKGVWVLCDEINLKIYAKFYNTTSAEWTMVPFFLPDIKCEYKTFLAIIDIRDGPVEDSVEFIIRVTENLTPRFYNISFSKNSMQQTEICVEHLNLLHLDDQATIWMQYNTVNADQYLVLWADSKTNISLLEISRDGRTLQEYFTTIPVPFGLHHAIFRAPYIFLGAVPYACSLSDYEANIKMLCN